MDGKEKINKLKKPSFREMRPTVYVWRLAGPCACSARKNFAMPVTGRIYHAF
jgi:hypothetical protein